MRHMNQTTSKSRGVGILMSKFIPISFISKQSDTEGRFIILNCEIFGERYTVVRVKNIGVADLSKHEMNRRS